MGPLQPGAGHSEPYHDEHLVIDYGRRAAVLDGTRMPLTRKEFELLAVLATHAGETVPRQDLLLQIWGYGSGIRTRTLDVHIRRLRKKMGLYSNRYLETIFGVGYRFQPFQTSRLFVVQPVLAWGA